MEAVLADIRADVEHLAADGVGDIVAQIHEGDQHLLVREQFTPAPAADGALSVLLGLLASC